MATPEQKLPLKFMIDSKRKKVIFAEAGSDFVDVLLSFLTLPLGTIIRRLNQHFGCNTNALGCFNNLYSSIQKFSDTDFVSKQDRHMLLHPLNTSQSALLKLKVDDSEPTKYYTCPNASDCYLCNNITTVYNFCRNCRRLKMQYLGGIFTKFTDSTKPFIITAGLRLMPGLDGLNFELIQNLASDVDEFEEKTINVGLNEIMHLLNLSLLSPAPLTNLLLLHFNSVNLKQSRIDTWAPNHEISCETDDSRKMVIKALVQKSTNKLLFFLAGDDVKELAYNIRTQEALDILKAALTSSTSAISNALQLMKQPKEEK